MTTLLTGTYAHVHFGIVDDPPVIPEQGGSIVLDETDTYAVADFDIPMLSPDIVDALDPRGTDLRVFINLNDRAFNLGLRERTVDHATRTIHIRAASDEALLGEYVRLADSLYLGNVRAVVNAVLGLVIPGAVLSSSGGSIDGPIAEYDARMWKAGTSAWDFLLPLTSAIGGRLFCDELRVWRLVPTSYTVEGVVSAAATNSRAATDTLSRDGEQWVTGVAIRYRWTTAAGEAKEVIDAAGLPGKVDIIDLDTPYPGPGVAAARLNRLRGQGRMQTAECVANYSATPGQQVRFTLPGAPEQIGRLQRVEFPLLDGFMDLQVRELTEVPPDAYLFGPDTVRYLDVPADLSYADFDWSDI